MREIPRVLSADPKAGYLAHREEIDGAIRRVLESGWYILGEEAEAFESEFAAYIGVGRAVGVGSGTDALHLALRACGVGPGDEVITVSHTASATVAAIDLCGAAPVLVDIDPATFTLDPNLLEGAITSRTRAIVPVHLYGHPADMEAIMDIARRHGLRVVEDCAQSHGAARLGRKTGAWGDMAAFSFYPTKNLGALGDGGMVVTDDVELGEMARLLREYGWRERYISDFAGMNSRLDACQAAVLRVKLRHLDRANARRRRLARLYGELLSGLALQLPFEAPETQHVYHQYVVRSDRRDALRAFLGAQGIGAAILYPAPVHRQPAYAACRMGPGGLGQSECAAREILCLPMYPELPEDHVEMVASAIHSFEAGDG